MTIQGANRFKTGERGGQERQDVWQMVNAAAGKSEKKPVANLGQGFFGYNPPDFVLEAAKQSFNTVECNQYAPPPGMPRLKKAIASAYSPFFGRDLDPGSEVLITTGANEGLGAAMLAFVNPGEEILIFEPYFDQYLRYARLCDAVVKPIALQPPAEVDRKTVSSADWTFDALALKKTITPKTRAIILNNPHNPIGKIFSYEELKVIGDLCVKHSILILYDEVYDCLYYSPFTRMAALSPEIAALTLTFGSAGKIFYATGWRIGYIIGPKNLIASCTQAHMWLCYASPSPLQEAVALAFEQAEINGFWETCKSDMKNRMDRFNQIWDEIGLPYTNPQGGYFVLVNTKKIQIPDDFMFPPEIQPLSRDFKVAWFLILEFGVVSIPPADFYSLGQAHLAENYLRFGVCKMDDVLDLAKEKLRGLKKYIKV